MIWKLEVIWTHRGNKYKLGDGNFGGGKDSQPVERWQISCKHIILDEEAGKILDEQSGIQLHRW